MIRPAKGIEPMERSIIGWRKREASMLKRIWKTFKWKNAGVKRRQIWRPSTILAGQFPKWLIAKLASDRDAIAVQTNNPIMIAMESAETMGYDAKNPAKGELALLEKGLGCDDAERALRL